MATDRTERVRQVIDGILRAQPDVEERRAGFIHLYGVAQACALLALRRGLDVEIGTIEGMLHDIWSYETGDGTDHAQRGAPMARQILLDLGCFVENEINVICEAIARHSMKGEVHGAYDELLKDADVLQHYLYNVRFYGVHRDEDHRARLIRVWSEMGIHGQANAT